MNMKSKSRWLFVATVAAVAVVGFAGVQVMAQDDIDHGEFVDHE